jgi:hypothetical protein
MQRYRNKNILRWQGDTLCHGRRKLVTIIQDQNHPTMWRIRLPHGSLTDMVNRTRAKDAAQAIALAVLSSAQTPVEAAPAA